MPDVQSEILSQLGILNGQVGELKGTMQGYIMAQTETKEKVKEHDKRLDALEAAKYKLIGAVAAGSAFISFVGTNLYTRIFG